ncbi:MAG: hypothetical protein AAGI66_01225 [Cyanobacteria bacterium P01_H01_bin.74]
MMNEEIPHTTENSVPSQALTGSGETEITAWSAETWTETITLKLSKHQIDPAEFAELEHVIYQFSQSILMDLETNNTYTVATTDNTVTFDNEKKGFILDLFSRGIISCFKKLYHANLSLSERNEKLERLAGRFYETAKLLTASTETEVPKLDIKFQNLKELQLYMRKLTETIYLSEIEPDVSRKADA